MRESVRTFTCEGASLLGIVAEPTTPAAPTAVLIIVGGPQYRAGSHRQFTLLARHLAGHGFASLRFDYRGMGDSEGTARGFEDVQVDIAKAIDTLLVAVPRATGVVLFGLCDAAAAALMYYEASGDSRVRGLALQNPWFRSEQGQAQAVMTHYYGKRLRSWHFWKKLLTGGVGVAAVRSWFDNRRLAQATPAAPRESFRDRMLRGWTRSTCPVLLQLALEDLTAQEFVIGFSRARPGWADRAGLTRHDHAETDHTFSYGAAKRKVQEQFTHWLQEEFPP